MKYDSLFNTLNKTVIPLLAIILSLTPFYGIAYTLAIVFATKNMGFSKTFSTVFGRTVLSILFLAAIIMIAGMGTWLLQIPTHPVIILLLFYGFVRFIERYQKSSLSSHKIMDRGDVASVALAIIAPIVIVISFQLPNPSHAALYQFLNNGWDNSSHLLMLESASLENGYLYGPYSELKDKTITKFNSYPQAWHLATANITNGFGFKPFDPSQQVRELATYATVLFAWYMTVVYLFTKVTWRLLKSTKAKLNATAIVLFCGINVVIQCVLFWGSLTSGFANYLGCIAYLIILVGIILERKNDNNDHQHIAALVAGTAASLCWFLPLPAVVLMIILSFWHKVKYPFWKIENYLHKPWYIYITTLVAAAIVLGQVAIFIIFSHVSGDSQLNAGRLGGAFEVSQLFLFTITILALSYWMVSKAAVKSIIEKVISIVTPLTLLTLFIYIYQLVTAGVLSYYFGKSMGLLLVVSSILFVPAFVAFMCSLEKYRLSTFSILILGGSSLAMVLIGTNQSIDSASQLLQRSSKTSYPVAQEIIKYLKNENPSKTKLVVLRGKHINEDYNGNLASKLPHLPMTCAYSVVNSASSTSLSLKLGNLDSCASKIKNIDILVITSNKTRGLIEEIAKKHDNIQVVNVP